MTIALIVRAFLVVLVAPDIEVKGTASPTWAFIMVYGSKALMLVALMWAILALEGTL
jgi:hypothetical protein